MKLGETTQKDEILHVLVSRKEPSSKDASGGRRSKEDGERMTQSGQAVPDAFTTRARRRGAWSLVDLELDCDCDRSLRVGPMMPPLLRSTSMRGTRASARSSAAAERMDASEVKSARTTMTVMDASILPMSSTTD